MNKNHYSKVNFINNIFKKLKIIYYKNQISNILFILSIKLKYVCLILKYIININKY